MLKKYVYIYIYQDVYGYLFIQVFLLLYFEKKPRENSKSLLGLKTLFQVKKYQTQKGWQKILLQLQS